MQRGSDRLSFHRDNEMKAELRGQLRYGHPTRTAEWTDPEPAAEYDPEVVSGPEPPWHQPGRVNTLHYELARNLGRTPFPAKPGRLRSALRDKHAPDELIERLRELPGDIKYANAHELAEALVQASERAEEKEA